MQTINFVHTRTHYRFLFCTMHSQLCIQQSLNLQLLNPDTLGHTIRKFPLPNGSFHLPRPPKSWQRREILQVRTRLDTFGNFSYQQSRRLSPHTVLYTTACANTFGHTRTQYSSDNTSKAGATNSAVPLRNAAVTPLFRLCLAFCLACRALQMNNLSVCLACSGMAISHAG